MQLLRRYRQWRFASAGTIPRPLQVLLCLALMAATFVLGVTWQDSPDIPKEVASAERAQILELQNRLDIQEQALQNIKGILEDWRERYNFLLSMMNMELQRPAGTSAAEPKKGEVNVRYFKINAPQNGLYPYQLLLDDDQVGADVRYGLIFEFDRGEPIRLELDSSSYTNSQGKRIALPFIGSVNGGGRGLRMTTFYVHKNNKEVFSMQSKFEG